MFYAFEEHKDWIVIHILLVYCILHVNYLFISALVYLYVKMQGIITVKKKIQRVGITVSLRWGHSEINTVNLYFYFLPQT